MNLVVGGKSSIEEGSINMLTPENSAKLNDASWCKQQVDAGRSLTDMAKECGCSVALVCRRLKTFGIKANKTKMSEKLNDVVLLTSLYEGRNASQVAEILQCNKNAVLDALRRHEIPLKDASEYNRLRNTPLEGSNAPRPRKKFLSTTQDPEWLRARAERGDSVADIARESGASSAAVNSALTKFKIELMAPEPKQSGPRIVPFKERVKRSNRTTSRIACAHGMARSLCPHGPCVACGAPGYDVNHIDRNPFNNVPENLERLCRKCHNRQHAEELYELIAYFEESGKPFSVIAERARVRVLARNGTEEQSRGGRGMHRTLDQ